MILWQHVELMKTWTIREPHFHEIIDAAMGLKSSSFCKIKFKLVLLLNFVSGDEETENHLLGAGNNSSNLIILLKWVPTEVSSMCPTPAEKLGDEKLLI